MAIKADVKKAAYSILARREYSQHELRQKLQLKEFACDDIEDVLAALDKQGIQSDFRFAESAMRARVNKGYGWAYICAELEQKGLTSDIISAVYESQPVDWFNVAEKAYEKRFADPVISDQKEKQKRIRFLQYRGFDFEQIDAILNLD